MDLVSVSLGFHRVTEADWYSSEGLDNFLSYDSATDTVLGLSKKVSGLIMVPCCPCLHLLFSLFGFPA